MDVSSEDALDVFVAAGSPIFFFRDTTPMTPYQKRMNPFIRRMAEDMQVRNFSPSTIDSYTFHVDKFCQHFGKPAALMILHT